MAEAKIFRIGTGTQLEAIGLALERYLREEKQLETQGVSQSDTCYFIQARQPEEWKKFVGLDQAVQVKMTLHGDLITVDVGAGRWVDKLGAATVGYLVFAPLLVTAAIGAVGQEQLPKDIFSFVERFLLLERAPESAESGRPVCHSCHAPLPADARFCPQCGSPVPTVRACPACGAEAAADARFCTECGSPLK